MFYTYKVVRMEFILKDYNYIVCGEQQQNATHIAIVHKDLHTFFLAYIVCNHCYS